MYFSTKYKIAYNCLTLTGIRSTPRTLHSNLTAYPITMSLTLQSALNHFKTRFMYIKIQAIKETKFSSSIEKSILGCFHPSQNLTGTTRDDFALTFIVPYLVLKCKISFLVKFDWKV